VARRFVTLASGEVGELLASPVHEHRLAALLVLGFLDAHASRTPRTTLGCATEHVSPEQRAHYRVTK
jgi:hypothetical protein